MEHNVPECSSVAMEHDAPANDFEITAAPIDSSAVSACTSCIPMPSAIWQAVRERNADLVRSIIQASTVDLLRDEEQYCPRIFYCSRACYSYLDQSTKIANHVDYTLATSMPLLHFAVTRGEIEIISQLIAVGADLEARDSRGHVALEYAIECNNQAAIDLLVANGANVNAFQLNRIPGNKYPLHFTTEVLELMLQHGADPALKSDQGWTALHIAAANAHDDAELITRFMDRGVPINEVDTDGCSALHLAIKSMNKPKTVEVLLQRNADPSKARYNGDFPLMMAVKRNQLRVTKSLLRHKACPNQRMLFKPTVLQVACNHGDEDIALELIKAGADLTDADQSGTYVIHSVVKSGMFPVIKEVVERISREDLNVRDNRGYTPLLWACRKADKETVKLLLEKGACDKDKTIANENVLHCLTLTSFSEFAAVEIAEYFIDRGVDGINEFDRKGFTPFHIACIKNRLNLVELFSKRGANIHLRTHYHSSPLLLAVKNGSYASVLYLLKLGSKINEVCLTTGTALHLACKHERRHTIQLLLDQGADINVLNRYKRTPFNLMNHQNVFESCKIMIRHIAKITIRGEHVNEKDLHTIRWNEELCQIYDDCIAELTMMRTRQFYSSITWLDVLFMSHAKLETLYKNWTFVEITIAHFKEMPYPYPMYHREMRSKFESWRMKRRVIEEAEQFVFDIFNDYFPLEITHHIARLMIRKELIRIENNCLFDF